MNNYTQAKSFAPKKANRVYMDVPFNEKDLAKLMKSWWDDEAKSWYTTFQKIKQFPQVCRWLPPGELKLWAKNQVLWLQHNDPSELLDIGAVLDEQRRAATEAAALASNRLMSELMSTNRNSSTISPSTRSTT